MKASDLVARYPRAFHVTYPGNWNLIERFGLRSTTALLELFAVDPDIRQRINTESRRDAVVLEHPRYGRLSLRDQRPLSLKKLAGKLRGGISAEQWLQLLNRKVFFWLSEHKFRDLTEARTYRGTRQLVITVDTAELVRRYDAQIELCPINSGTTNPFAHPRGRDSFMSIEAYPYEQRRKDRGVKDAIAELTVDYAVPDLMEFVIEAEEIGGGLASERLWPT